jgi:site-specific recombinase XerD
MSCPINCLIGHDWRPALKSGKRLATTQFQARSSNVTNTPTDPSEPMPARDATPLPALVPTAGILDVLHQDLERAAAYKKAARSDATHRGYASDWAIFGEWCASRGLVQMPAHPEQVAAFAAAQADAGFKPSTIERRVAAIGHYHRAANLVAPTAHPEAGGLREALAGIRNSKRHRTVRKDPADARALSDMLASIKGNGLRALRDRAVLAIGMAGALRRSELVALTLSDAGIHDLGLEIYIDASKTDQAGAGTTIAIPEGARIRPKVLLLEWIAAVRTLEVGLNRTAEEWAATPLFRLLTRGDNLTQEPMSDRSIARLVKHYAGLAGYDAEKFAGHSLRAGFLTEAAATGATIFKMQEVSRHKTVQILVDYVRSADRFRDHAGERFL